MAAHWKGALVQLALVSEVGCSKMKRYPVQSLAGGTVAVLGSQRFLPTQLVLHGAAVAFALPLDVKLALVVNLVWWPLLPPVFLTICGRTSLILVRFGTVTALVAVLVFYHFAEDGGGWRCDVVAG
jgi:hypothetical protein